MRFRKGTFPRSDFGFAVNQVPYDTFVVAEQEPLTLNNAGGAAVAVNSIPAGTRFAWIELRNSSTGGQIIKVGIVADFVGAGHGIPLNPGDTMTLEYVHYQLVAITNVNGAQLDRMIVQTV